MWSEAKGRRCGGGVWRRDNIGVRVLCRLLVKKVVVGMGKGIVVKHWMVRELAMGEVGIGSRRRHGRLAFGGRTRPMMLCTVQGGHVRGGHLGVQLRITVEGGTDGLHSKQSSRHGGKM